MESTVRSPQAGDNVLVLAKMNSGRLTEFSGCIEEVSADYAYFALDSAKVTVEKSCDSAIYNESFAQCPASNDYQLSLIHRAFDSRFDNSVIPLQSPRFFSAEIKNR